MTAYVETFRTRSDTDERTAIGLGSGFIVLTTQGPALVTNWHVLTGRNRITGDPRVAGQPLPDQIDVWFWTMSPTGAGSRQVATVPLYDEEERPRWIVHPQHGRLVDVAILHFPVSAPEGSKLMPYELASPIGPALVFPTSDVNIVGYPAVVEGRSPSAVWTRATVASEPGEDFDDLPSFLVDARARDGQSGSPVIGFWLPGEAKQTALGATIEGEMSWELLGIYSGRITDESDLGRVWKRSAIQDVFASGVRDDVIFI